MSSFHESRPRWRGLWLTTDADDRLPRGISILVIGVLSALSWAMLIGIVMAVRAAF